MLPWDFRFSRTRKQKLFPKFSVYRFAIVQLGDISLRVTITNATRSILISCTREKYAVYRKNKHKHHYRRGRPWDWGLVEFIPRLWKDMRSKYERVGTAKSTAPTLHRLRLKIKEIIVEVLQLLDSTQDSMHQCYIIDL